MASDGMKCELRLTRISQVFQPLLRVTHEHSAHGCHDIVLLTLGSK